MAAHGSAGVGETDLAARRRCPGERVGCARGAYDDDGTWLELLVNGVGELRTTATLPEGAHFLAVDVSTDQGPSDWALAPK